jgi:hypothetical protein
VKYDKNIALKYIKNILLQYNNDGLSSQRYSRVTQKGIGEDILAGISTTITALYRDIYGIRPKWNRMGLEPSMLNELNGTEFKYSLRDTVYNISLRENSYQITTKDFSAKSSNSFGVNMSGNTLHYYPGNLNLKALAITRTSLLPINIEVSKWNETAHCWTVNSKGNYQFSLAGLQPNSTYNLIVNGNKKQSFQANATGIINFDYKCKIPTSFCMNE